MKQSICVAISVAALVVGVASHAAVIRGIWDAPVLAQGTPAPAASRVTSSAQPTTPATATKRPLPAPKLVAAHATAESTLISTDEQTGLVKQYCATCHSERGKAGGLTLAEFDAAKLADHAELAEKMIRKLRAGMMPPPGARRPEPAKLVALTTALETRIDLAATLSPNPGSRPFQRMNRAEYARSVRDLVGIEVDVTAYLPPDTVSHGFDNVADVQSLSPTVMEGYLRAASQISRLAVGDRNATATSSTYKLGRTMSQMRHIEGTPIGTRGGIAVTHVFPADGEYAFKVAMHYEPLGGLFGRTTMSTMGIAEQVEVSIDGERVALLDLNTRMSESDPKNNLEPTTPAIHVKAGPHVVAAAFIERFNAIPDDLLVPVENTLVDVSIGAGITVLPHMRDFTVIGPTLVTGVSDTPSRRKIFSCRPTIASEEVTCATNIIKRLAGQAFRTTLGAEELKDLIGFYQQGRKKSDFEGGVRLALQAILASPRFVFRFEEAPTPLRATRNQRLNDRDLASRLSFFLWGALPDAELLKVAASGTLKTGPVLERQIRRMLADPRSEALTTRFARQWLRLQDLDKIIPDYLQYPHYDDVLAQGLQRETELFFDSLLREDRSILDLITADYSFLNERVARHYGVPNVTGDGFRRVNMPENRRGILGHGSILALTSNSDRTSPVFRGKWIMEVLLGTPPPPPPDNVPPLDETKATDAGKFLSVRERMEQHRKNPTCNSCHRVIDPLGLALENYDVTGAWRIKDNEVAVDPVGDMYDGTRMDGPAGLRNALLKHKDMLLLSFTESLMTYGLGRRVEYFDMPTIRAIVRDVERSNYKVSAFVLAIAKSPAFQMRRLDEGSVATELSGNR
jgi:mono/diheme cytochrome c family protein